MPLSSFPCSSFAFRTLIPDKSPEEEKALLQKKLAEQRAKAEGIPTTAKVSLRGGYISRFNNHDTTVIALPEE